MTCLLYTSAAIHNAYFEAGADIIETNTFNSTTIAMADYQMESLSAEISFAAAKLARACADAVSYTHLDVYKRQL